MGVDPRKMGRDQRSRYHRGIRLGGRHGKSLFQNPGLISSSLSAPSRLSEERRTPAFFCAWSGISNLDAVCPTFSALEPEPQAAPGKPCLDVEIWGDFICL